MTESLAVLQPFKALKAHTAIVGERAAKLWTKYPRETVGVGVLGLAAVTLGLATLSQPEAAHAQVPPAPPPLLVREIPKTEAVAVNQHIPLTAGPNPAAAPFKFKGDAAARSRATECLASAVYYEAGQESADGQRAVAQVVLNRVQHPEFPNSVCGVVYQGWERTTGCQFSFTCDGSLLRGPIASIWRRNQQLAEEALNGHVVKEVGTATFYHADYVVPYWRSSLSKVHKIGRHIFYRWPGRVGEPFAFDARYGGNELRLSEAVLTGRAPRALPAPGELPAGLEVETVVVADASAPGGTTTRVRTSLGGRRQPTPEDIAAINAKLKAFEAAPAAPEAPKPSADGVIEINKPAAAG